MVKTAATLFRNFCYNEKDRLSAAIIIAGYDDVSQGSLYCIPLGGTCVRMPYAIGGSGSTYIYGYCDSEYRPGMTKDECLAFVKNGA